MAQLNHIIAVINSWQQKKLERLSWDEYFMATAFLTSSRSPDQRLKVGCALVKDNHIISQGYNGFLPSLPHQSFIEDGHELATVHAEQNCISDCSKRGVKTDGASAYVTHYPCINCFKILAAAGVKTIYYQHDYRNHKLVNILAHQARIQIIKLDQSLPSNYVDSSDNSKTDINYANMNTKGQGLPKIKSQQKMSFFGTTTEGINTDEEDN
jgi:dCMP deaminase